MSSPEKFGGGSEDDGLIAPRKKSEALWMMSFSDMCLVLLCFFVLLISIMKPDQTKLDQVTEKMKSETVQEKVKKTKQVKNYIEETLKKNKLENAATVIEEKGGLVIEFASGMLFKSGSSRSNARFQQTVDKILKSIVQLPKDTRMVIEGHTDDSPLRGTGFIKSNWELSAARGFTMMRQLKKAGFSEKRMSVASYGSTQPKVAFEGLKGRALKAARSKNRRVVLRIFE